MDGGHIGVDESGKGDFFGPLIIAACYVGPEHLAELEGVKDSKKLTDEVALRLSSKIRAVCPCEVIVLNPPKYNELYAKMRNLNHILEWGHARAIENVLEKQSCDLAISDQFANPAGLRRRLFERGREIELRSLVRAEADIAVAAASVLARAEFLRRLRMLGDSIETRLPKGASAEVVRVAVALVRSKGQGALAQVSKRHFKTFNEVLEAAGAAKS